MATIDIDQRRSVANCVSAHDSSAVDEPKTRAPYVERLIESVRRECLDHTIVLSQRHLKRILADYSHYYRRWRTHQALEMDCPEGRKVHSIERGRILEVAEAGGLHHHHERVAS